MILFLTALLISLGMVFTLPTSAQSLLSFCLLAILMTYESWNYYRKKSTAELLLIKSYILLFVALFELAKDGNFLFLALRKLSLFVSAVVAALMGKPIALGLTYSGLELVFSFLIVGLCFLFFYKIKLKHFAYYALLCLGLWAVYIGLWSLMAENSIHLGLNLLEPITGALDYRALLFALLLLNLQLFRRRYFDLKTLRDLGFLKRLKDPRPIFLIYLLLLLFLLPTFVNFGLNQRDASSVNYGSEEGESRKEGSRIVFWDTGIDFELPKYGSYGLDHVGMFGALPRYFMMRGEKCLMIKNIERSDLEGVSALVIINPMRLPKEGEIEAITDYVKQGGTVILAGDHTCQEVIREPINAILKDVNVELNFDSAVGFKTLWGGKYEKKGELTAGLQDRQIQIVVGASLTIDSRSTAIVRAGEGYSDRGNTQNVEDGFLGDMKFNPGEEFGDLILASETSLGSGKYILFGDTTPFQNTVLPYSYPLIDRLFSLSHSKDGFQSKCIINASNLEKISRDKSLESIDGFLANVMRAGLMPLVNYSASLESVLKHEDGVELIVLMEPAISLTDEELSLLEDFMRGGGRVLLCADYRSPKAAKDVAGYFGFTLMKMPIGRIAPDKDKRMAFWNACPLLYEGKNPEESGVKDVESLMSVWGYSTMATKRIGDGDFILFADGNFLKNKNLEHIDTYREGNIDFLKTILKRANGGE